MSKPAKSVASMSHAREAINRLRWYVNDDLVVNEKAIRADVAAIKGVKAALAEATRGK